jgi:phosphonate transport system substrate-binding protein
MRAGGSRWWRARAALACVLLLVAGFVPAAHVQEPPLVLGVFPRYNFALTVESFTPLARHLSTRLGRNVVIDTSSDFDSFWLGVIDRRYDIVHYNQYHYLRSHRDYNYRVILMNEEFGESTIAGAISTRADRGIHTLADLKGRTMIFGGDRSAMQSYIVATYLLRRAGLRPGDYAEKFANNPPNAHLAVYFGQADAAGVGDRIADLPAVRGRVDPGAMKLIAVGEPLAHLPWAVRGDLDPKLGERIRAALLELRATPEGRSVLKQAKLTGLVAASDRDFDPHRRIIETVFGVKY